MRIIGGEFRSRRIKSLPGLDVRPTPDRLREALFNVLAPRIGGSVFIDAFAGSGAVGLEAISRGAARVVFVEKKRAAVLAIRENLLSLGVASGYEIRQASASAALAKLTGDIVFLDPPYEADREYETCLRALGTNPPPLAIVQHAARRVLEERYGDIHRKRVVTHGDNALSFYEPAEKPRTEAPGKP
ncbi:MAG: 16S rRNA (guanine(966)-N(2))-methyltransferase RsmD [Bryobacteraceae bacterium]|nr:16S rRNA (guanine(966)-N(2))-methyltransferase RsmD [Bryobacteraceae bacterium]